jgi:hypothetical protein
MRWSVRELFLGRMSFGQKAADASKRARGCLCAGRFPCNDHAMVTLRAIATVISALALAGCSPNPSSNASTSAGGSCGGSGALAGCLAPTKTDSYYIAQAELYFDTLDVTKDPEKYPNYSQHVARWEWLPWLKLTGYGRAILVQGNKALTIRDGHTTVPVKDCRAFPKQPFARCYVEFDYEGKRCPIYEEFFFNDAGDTTFIEAWSNLPGKLPMADANDKWAEGAGVRRLGSKVPTLGGPAGDLDVYDDAYTAAAKLDPELADLLARSENFTSALVEELNSRVSEKAMYAEGCGWPAEQ